MVKVSVKTPWDTSTRAPSTSRPRGSRQRSRMNCADSFAPADQPGEATGGEARQQPDGQEGTQEARPLPATGGPRTTANTGFVSVTVTNTR